jgi:hypothetical protein
MHSSVVSRSDLLRLRSGLIAQPFFGGADGLPKRGRLALRGNLVADGLESYKK